MHTRSDHFSAIAQGVAPQDIHSRSLNNMTSECLHAPSFKALRELHIHRAAGYCKYIVGAYKVTYD